MSGTRTGGRRTNQRAFRPALEAALETRALLSKVPAAFFLAHPKVGYAFQLNQPPFKATHAPAFKTASLHSAGTPVLVQTAHGGQSARVTTPYNGQFSIALTQFIPTTPTGAQQTATSQQNPIQGQVPGAGGVQAQGTVRAYPMPGGRVGLIVDGSTTQTELDISPDAFPQQKGYAHSFAYGQAGQSHVLNIGQITVTSGQIGAILGYHSATLSGPLVVAGTAAVDRIAFQSLAPGASILTGGDLNTLDIANGVNLNSGPGIVIGRDLNLFNAGQDVNLSNGASIQVGRFLGLVPQPPKGTANGANILALNQALVGSGTSQVVPSLSGYLQGNLNLGARSYFSVGQGVANSSITGATQSSPAAFLINGMVTATAPNQIVIPNLQAGTTFVSNFSVPTTPPQNFTIFNNFVARAGYNIPGFTPNP